MDAWLIVGLGNPGKKYEKTRHNFGFMVVDSLARKTGAQIKREECCSLIGSAKIENSDLELVKPQTFMNLSGEAIACLLKKEGRSIGRMIVIADDLALPLGKIRIRRKGSSGGHNGLKSIISSLGTEEFIRLRIGIRPEYEISDTKQFVLESFSDEDIPVVEEILQKSADAVCSIILEGVDKAMAKFN
ncbi:MAG: aminoacyl-tRNA hydrolase [Acidobacteria bacterium]|nr:MAG: aminoacyl-tRNA hydrolase [Acidobacteriota bacterium]